MRKKVSSLPCTPPSFKNRSYFHKKALLACRPGGLSCGRRMLPHAVCDVASGLFSFGKSPARPACAQKTNACSRQACDIRAVKSVTVAQRGGPVHSSEKNVFGIGRGTGKGRTVSTKTHFSFPQPALRQNSHPHFDGRSSSGLHAYDDERRHNGFGCRSCSPQASGERITGVPPLLLRMPDPGLHHGASWPCAPAFLVSPV